MDFAAQSKKGRRNRKITAPLIFVPLSPSPSSCAFLFAGSLPLSTLAIAIPFASQPLFLAMGWQVSGRCYGTDGKIRRVRCYVILGTKGELPTKRLAELRMDTLRSYQWSRLSAPAGRHLLRIY